MFVCGFIFKLIWGENKPLPLELSILCKKKCMQPTSWKLDRIVSARRLDVWF